MFDLVPNGLARGCARSAKTGVVVLSRHRSPTPVSLCATTRVLSHVAMTVRRDAGVADLQSGILEGPGKTLELRPVTVLRLRSACALQRVC
jgi:hypothetical protein